jgi:hypothetical protein
MDRRSELVRCVAGSKLESVRNPLWPCSIDAVPHRDSHHRTFCHANRIADCNPNGDTDCSANCCTDHRTYCGANGVTDCSANCCTDHRTYCGANGVTDCLADTYTNRCADLDSQWTTVTSAHIRAISSAHFTANISSAHFTANGAADSITNSGTQ